MINSIDNLLQKSYGYTEGDIRKFKSQIIDESVKYFRKSNRGSKNFHMELLLKQVPDIKSHFPLATQKRKEVINPLTKKRTYEMVIGELKWSDAIQSWSTTICNEKKSISKSSKSNSNKKVSNNTVNIPVSTMKNTFKMDVDYKTLSDDGVVEFNTVINYFKEGAKQVETPSGYKIQF